LSRTRETDRETMPVVRQYSCPFETALIKLSRSYSCTPGAYRAHACARKSARAAPRRQPVCASCLRIQDEEAHAATIKHTRALRFVRSEPRTTPSLAIGHFVSNRPRGERANEYCGKNEPDPPARQIGWWRGLVPLRGRLRLGVVRA